MTKTMPSGGWPVTLEQLSSHLQLRLEIAVVVVVLIRPPLHQVSSLCPQLWRLHSWI